MSFRHREKKAASSGFVVPETLYHGTERRLKVLTPRNEHGDPDSGDLVFASPSRRFALAYAGGRWSDRDLNQGVEHDNPEGSGVGVMNLREMAAGTHDRVFSRPGYMYHLPGSSFREIPGRHSMSEVGSKEPVTPKKVERIANLLEELRKDPTVRLHPYDPKHPETRKALSRQVVRMKAMTPEAAAQYRRWRLDNAPKEVAQMFEEEEKAMNSVKTAYDSMALEFVRQALPEKSAALLGKDDVPKLTGAAGAGTAAGLAGGRFAMGKTASVDLYVDKSEDMDRGMFAERDFEPGEVIEIAPVLVVPRRQIRNNDVLRNYVFNFDKDNVMVALGYASMFNHSYKPNARYKKDKGSRTLTFTAIKPIKEGQEIFVNYNLDPNKKDPLWFDVKEKQTDKTAAEDRDWKQKAKRWAPGIAGVAGGAGLAAGGIIAAHPALRAQVRAGLRGARTSEMRAELPQEVVQRGKAVASKLREMGIDPKKHRIGISGAGGTGKSTLTRALEKELGMGRLHMDEFGVSLKGRDIPKYLREGGRIEPGTIAEQTHLTNQVDPDMFDYMIRIDAPQKQVKKQIIARGRGAGQLAWYDYPKLRKTIRKGFDLTEGTVQKPISGVQIKARPQSGFRAADIVKAELSKKGLKPTGDRQKDLMSLAYGSTPVLPGILPYLRKGNIAAGAGIVGAGAAGGGYAADSLAEKMASTRVLYHGTKPSLYGKILKDGLDPSTMGTGFEGDPDSREEQATSLSTNLEHAQAYANLGAMREARGVVPSLKAALGVGVPKPLVVRIPKNFPIKRVVDAEGHGGFDEWHSPSKIPPEYIKTARMRSMRSALEQMA